MDSPSKIWETYMRNLFNLIYFYFLSYYNNPYLFYFTHYMLAIFTIIITFIAFPPVVGVLFFTNMPVGAVFSPVGRLSPLGWYLPMPGKIMRLRAVQMR